MRAARERKVKTSSVVVPAGPASVGGKPASGSVVCDVRGKPVEEAMRKVETALNELIRDENATITIIHGHGSEKLKDSIRGYIQKERDDLAFRPGTWPGEGGDGVTVVEKSH
jgi:dsDNA-specific endonuclease/ATPase MutS2